MTRTLFLALVLALAASGSAPAADPDPRSPKDLFGNPRAHGPAVGKAFLGLYSGRTDLFFGQPMLVELFAIPASPNGPFVHPHLPSAKLALTDDRGRAVPFELDDRGYSGSGTGEYVYFRLLPTKAHTAGGYWKPGTYVLTVTIVNAPNPTNPVTQAGTFVSNELKFVVRAADAPRDEVDPARALAKPAQGFGRPNDHFWLHAAGLSEKAQTAERERLKFGAEGWAVHTARVGPVTVPQDRALTDAEEKRLIEDLTHLKDAGARTRGARSVPPGASKEVLAALLPRLADEYWESFGGFESGPVYPVRGVAGESLVRLGPAVAPTLVDAARGELYRPLRSTIAGLLGGVGHHPDAEKWLGELIVDDSDDLQYAAQAAAARWGAAGNKLSRQMLARQATRKEIRRAAAEALGVSGDLKTDGPILRPLLESKEEDVQRAAVGALARLKDTDSLPAFERIARDAAIDQNTRYPAVDAVLEFADKRTGDKLLLDLIARPDDRLRGFALVRAGKRKLDAARPLALDALDDKDWYTRVMADYALRGLAGDSAGVGYDPGKPDPKAWRAFWAKREKP
jgi:HEAT repeat protein